MYIPLKKDICEKIDCPIEQSTIYITKAKHEGFVDEEDEKFQKVWKGDETIPKVRLWNWGIGRIIAAIYLIPTTFLLVTFWLLTACDMIPGKNTSQDYRWSTHIIFMFLVLLQVGLLYLTVSSKEYKCMNPVCDFMKYRTLKRCIHKEEFEEPIRFYDVEGIKTDICTCMCLSIGYAYPTIPLGKSLTPHTAFQGI